MLQQTNKLRGRAFQVEWDQVRFNLQRIARWREYWRGCPLVQPAPCYQPVEATSGKFAPSLKDNLSSRLKLLPLRDSVFLAPNSYFTTPTGLRLNRVTEYPPQFNLRLAGLEPKSRPW